MGRRGFNFGGSGRRGHGFGNWNRQPIHGFRPNIGGPVASGAVVAGIHGRVIGAYMGNFGRGGVNVLTYGNSVNRGNPVVTNPQPVIQPPVVKPDANPAVQPNTGVLTVRNVNLKVPGNGAAHRTNRYHISRLNKANPKLVVRRGQPFSIDIDFSKPYNEKADDLKIIFEAGDKPLTSKKTYVEFILSAEDKPKEWGAKITSTTGNVVTVDIFTPPTCFIGKWNLKIDVVKKEETVTNVLRYQHNDPIYIICNPWCRDDAVYMPEENLLNEYVLNETGIIYTGDKTLINFRPWNYGQFETCVLDVALYLLDVSGMDWAVRGNPIFIIRKLSAMVNSNDEGGILTGKWGNNYAGGISPSRWTGSVPILEQYWQSKKSVCYGQCWVFSGICTTICRALGIPTRCITNYQSAHDTDGSITLDVHFKANGQLDRKIVEDRIWNFHCWNEAYMSRPDLPAGYGGWQVFDSTPQEVSDGVYCSGPTSVVAIQNGEVNLPYDAPFVFAEVNADTLYWYPNSLGVLQCTRIVQNAVGMCISTKAPNSYNRDDITGSYKHPEGSPEERAAVLKANQVGSSRRDLYKKMADDVAFKIIQDPANRKVGASFHVGLSLKNNSTVKRVINGRISVGSMFYTGVFADKIKSEPFTNIVLQPGEEKKQMVEVKENEYIGKLKDYCMLDVTILATVNETGQIYTSKEAYTLSKPQLSVKAPGEATASKECKIDVSFTNPLSLGLTGCAVTVDGVGPVRMFPQGNVAPSGNFTATLSITPTKVGNHNIIVIFNSKQLENINHSCPIVIRS